MESVVWFKAGDGKPPNKGTITMSEEKPKVPIKLVYAGRRVLDSSAKKIGYKWVNLDDPNKGSIYDQFHPLGCSIGTGFTVDHSEDLNSVYLNSYRDVFKFENDELIAKWEVEDKSAYHSNNQTKLVKQLGKDSAFSDAVEPLKKIYKKLMHTNRQTFLLMLIQELEK
jgi:hypothetical protein